MGHVTKGTFKINTDFRRSSKCLVYLRLRKLFGGGSSFVWNSWKENQRKAERRDEHFQE